MSLLLKAFFIFLAFIPLGYAEQPATTQTSVESPATTVAEGLRFEEYFSRGTKSYQDKSYTDAALYFEKALDLHPDSATTLTNLGLSYFQTQKPGLAIAMFRRAIYVDPSQKASEAALKYALSQLEVKEIPHQIETYERLRAAILNEASLNSFHALTALLLFASGFVWLRFMGRRRKSLAEENAPPPVPAIGILLLFGLSLSTILTVLKSYDLTVPRATIIVDKVSAQTAPGEEQDGLFDLYAGFEVIIRNTAQDWVQISYPGGLTGWVKKDSLISTSGKNAF